MNRVCKHPLRLFLVPPSQPAASAPPQEKQHLQDELTALKGAFQEEKELNAKHHEDLLVLLTALQAKLSPPAP